jgi:hypothetical protein
MGDAARNVTDKAKEVGSEQLAKATGSTQTSQGVGTGQPFPAAPGAARPDKKGAT